MWRYGVLYRSCALIEQLAESPTRREEVLSSFSEDTFRNVKVDDVLAVSLRAGWIVENEDGRLVATVSGRELIDARNSQMRMRIQVDRLIEVMQPDWAAMAVQGRQALLNYADPNVRQCFKEAGLTEEHSEDVVAWWDRLAGRFRGAKDYQYTEIGRRGERLSFLREFSRTGVEPTWVALELSDVGYDLVSRVSGDDENPLLIEVKTTTQSWDFARFFVSRHEWDVMSASNRAVFHLWCVKEIPAQHCTITIEQLQRHVPQDSGNGEWKKFACPFNDFEPTPSEVVVECL